MKKRILLTAWLILALGGLAAAEPADEPDDDGGPLTPWEEIVVAFRNGDLDAAFKKAREHEKSGDPDIICFLGDCYRNGAGTPVDGAAAMRCYKRVSDISYARFAMGCLYVNGNGVPVDKEKARKLIESAIADGMTFSAEMHASIIDWLRSKVKRYRDAALTVTFPEQAGDLQLKTRTLYMPAKKLGYSLDYKSSDGYLNLYIYNQAIADIPDGLPQVTLDELSGTFEEIAYLAKKGMYRNVRARTGVKRGELKKSRLPFAWEGFVYDFSDDFPGARTYILVFSAKKRFFKIRYTQTNPMPRSCRKNFRRRF